MTTPIDHWWCTAPRTAELRTAMLADPGPGEVRVAVAWTAISPGSNLHVWRTGGYGPDGASVPEDLVYMGSGVVAATGSGVTSVRAGDRVVIRGVGHQSGIVVPEARVVGVPDGLALRDAALAYLPSWAVSALHLGRYAAAETVIVTGLGLVGCSAALVAERMGARVLGLDVDPVRAAFARTLGLGAVAEPGTDAGARTIDAFLGADGPDLVLETTGAWAGLEEAIRRARDWTRIALMGIHRSAPSAEQAAAIHALLTTYPAKLHYGRLTFVGVGSDPESIPVPGPSRATPRTNLAWVLEQAARGTLPLGRLVTEVLPPDAIASALDRLAGGETRLVGVVFDWGIDR